MAYIIETERLILRNYRESDLDDYFDYISHPDVGPRLWGEPYKDKETALERLKLETQKPFQFAITLKQNNKVIGSVEIHETKQEYYDYAKLSQNSKTIGFLLSPKYWGQGIMPEAVQAILYFCFNELKLDDVGIAHNEANFQSSRVQDKVGFKIMGKAPAHHEWIDGKLHNSIYRKMTKYDYENNNILQKFKCLLSIM